MNTSAKNYESDWIVYDQWNEEGGRSQAHEREFAFCRNYLLDIEGPVLEAACGTGSILLCLAALGHEMWGFDISAAMLKQLRRKAGELSHGQKQWLEIGMLLAQEPKLLLVDEPAAGMTLAEREATTSLLVELAKTRAVVVVEHDMEFVRRLNCKVTVLHEGAVLAEGSLDHVTKNQEVIDVYLGR